MSSGSIRYYPTDIGDINPDGLQRDQLTSDQIAVALRSPYIQDVEPIPEPGTLVLLGIGLSAVALKLRKKF